MAAAVMATAPTMTTATATATAMASTAAVASTAVSPASRFRGDRHSSAHAQRQTDDAEDSGDFCRPNAFCYLLH
jgi:hypothetical protein